MRILIYSGGLGMPWAIGVSILSQVMLCVVLGIEVTLACDVVALAIVSIWLFLAGYLAGSDTPTYAEVMKPKRGKDPLGRLLKPVELQSTSKARIEVLPTEGADVLSFFP